MGGWVSVNNGIFGGLLSVEATVIMRVWGNPDMETGAGGSLGFLPHIPGWGSGTRTGLVCEPEVHALHFHDLSDSLLSAPDCVGYK